ncbi:hypothetical protein C5S29_01915, partial [ANME-1 cluster archaeon GoMg3.2]|nr:hypothetical protein [ANME-1 cluster archaeon GoMg3.2]
MAQSRSIDYVAYCNHKITQIFGRNCKDA